MRKLGEDYAIRLSGVSKSYRLYEKNLDRLKEILRPGKKSYHKLFFALQNVSFDIRRGETVGIIGVNGSGKSTLLKIISGIVAATTGHVEINGRVSAMLELGAGFNPDYTGLQNIYLNGSIMGYSREEMETKIPQILAFADIDDFISQPVKNYSSGMFARLAFAVAINVQPDILIVDEVLSVGDTRFQIKCMDRMQEMMKGGTTVLFVSHDVNAIRRFCSRAIWLNGGYVIRDGEVNRTIDEYLDFQKLQDLKTYPEKNDACAGAPFSLKQTSEDDLPKYAKGNNIAEIKRFRIYDEKGYEVGDTINYDQKIVLEVIYDVYETIEDPVLGIAVRTSDLDYTCGLNTLLDQCRIPWVEGRNRFYLEYTYGIRAMGGTYHFDVALFDKTASVPIQYISAVKQISVLSDYVGEGRYIIPHRWLRKMNP